jgi:hypothetical protein
VFGSLAWALWFVYGLTVMITGVRASSGRPAGRRTSAWSTGPRPSSM